MVLEKEILPFLTWLLPRVDSDGSLHLGSLLLLLIVLAGLIVASLFLAFLRMVILLGPVEAFYAVAKSVATAVSKDFPQTRMRRVIAMSRLAVQESLRRRVLVAFFVFALILLFAGWFLDPDSDHPARLYLGFVLSSAEPMMLILAILLSAFSLPTDIKNRTIYTVVTKPVRATEIVLGRIVGFVAVLSVLLLLVCAVSYGFVVRGLNHRHAILADDMQSIAVAAGDAEAGLTGITSRQSHHRHEVTIGSDGYGRTDRQMDHEHGVSVRGEGDSREFEVGPPRGALVARVPIYGSLRFMDRSGAAGQGISVGKEWSYRKYIEGGSLAAGVWTFEGITPERYPEYLPLEMNLSVFRTYKGDIVSGILGAITVKNPTTGLSSEPLPFTAKEFVTASERVPRKLKALDEDAGLRDIDLFEDLVDPSGRVEIWISCSEPGQYFGMAQADLYVRGRDGTFLWNFVKGYAGIWLQMVIITCFGVMFSTFLSGPVAMVATFVVYMVGLFKEFIIGVATGALPGGGPLEALLRTLTQRNITSELDMGPIVDRVVPALDSVVLFFMWIAANIFPDFRAFNTSRFVAHGFNISGNLLIQHVLAAAAFVAVLSIYGYFFLRSREVAA